MAYGAADPVFPPAHMERLRADIRGCPPAMVVEGGGHFIQEWGEPIARRALEALEALGD
jgi:pimeloyl-ACP methyl ester carboxylesterase